MDECRCERVVRLDMPRDGTASRKVYWICTVCNAEFVSKKAVDYKIKHLTDTLGSLVAEGKVEFEQIAGVWDEETVSESEGG